MTGRSEFVAFVADQMAGLGQVTVRRMFGGAGIFHAGAMIGLIADESLYLRSDHETTAEFERLGLEPFHYRKGAKLIAMAYHRAPEECLDDADQMALWAGKAYRAALRARAAKPRKSGRSRRATR
jgi:DNA transformation protein